MVPGGGFPGGASGKEPACHCRRRKRLEFDPWVRKMPQRRAWQPTPVFLPGESHGERSLEGYSPWGHKESDVTEATNTSLLTNYTILFYFQLIFIGVQLVYSVVFVSAVQQSELVIHIHISALQILFPYRSLQSTDQSSQCYTVGSYWLSILYIVVGEGNGTPLQYSCLENPMDGGTWQAAVHGVPRSQTRLSDFTFTFMHWRRKWQPTPVFLPGESQGRRSLVGCHLWGRTESDTTDATQQQQQQQEGSRH